jgi:hypothetical protein
MRPTLASQRWVSAIVVGAALFDRAESRDSLSSI